MSLKYEPASEPLHISDTDRLTQDLMSDASSEDAPHPAPSRDAAWVGNFDDAFQTVRRGGGGEGRGFLMSEPPPCDAAPRAPPVRGSTQPDFARLLKAGGVVELPAGARSGAALRDGAAATAAERCGDSISPCS